MALLFASAFDLCKIFRKGLFYKSNKNRCLKTAAQYFYFRRKNMAFLLIAAGLTAFATRAMLIKEVFDKQFLHQLFFKKAKMLLLKDAFLKFMPKGAIL